MNLGDYCPRGRELYAEYMVWHERHAYAWVVKQRIIAYQKFLEHVIRECAICKEE